MNEQEREKPAGGISRSEMHAVQKKLEKDKGKPSRAKNVKVPEKETKFKEELKGVRDDIENEDDEESYYRYIEENPDLAANKDDSDVELEYDEDGNPIAPAKSKYIDPLPPIDHSTIEYKEFTKNFYVEHEDIAKLSDAEVEELRATLGVKVTGALPLKPVTSFGHLGFDEPLLRAIRKAEYSQPSPIQAQGVPVALSGRDMIGIAKTGSGKTAAFIWPLLIHIMDQKELAPGDGPIGLILAPTRELAQQIYLEAKRFGKWEQSKALQEGVEIVVATPGRMIDMIKMKATNLERVTFLVLDEADRMFDMGFEPQVRSICDHVRPDRQTLMFSATFKRKVERLARDVLTDPIKVVQGDQGEANEDVTQNVLVIPSNPPGYKWNWLTAHLVEFTSVGSVLIFVTKKANAEELANNLQTQDHSARGLDIPHVKTVVNYDIARDIDTHTHRVGRTGRAGEKGVAYTLITDKEKEFAGHLVRNLEGASQHVPQSLMDLAMQSQWFKKSRFKQGKGKKLNMGGHGLGFRTRERPGLGCPEDAQYKSQFTAATDTSWKLGLPHSPPADPPLRHGTCRLFPPPRSPHRQPPCCPSPCRRPLHHRQTLATSHAESDSKSRDSSSHQRSFSHDSSRQQQAHQDSNGTPKEDTSRRRNRKSRWDI
ncbi:hypothetical protein HPB48_020555 [Haemaphysalis longicornis]|uniref:RNA helicase n=1 Tax=Haemaphysalis longicornis TaxID=44386 RepID=A0A9J6G5D1_HAELO|nr:hypothetical protein HPB48_020555 [Haemaphysalis longicornis]